MWEYLYKMDFRAWLVAGYLKGKTKDKVIFDINCMHAPLLKYLDQDYKEYIGNDLQMVFPGQYPRCRFYQTTDDRMNERLEEVDILVAFGIGGYEITKEPDESSTVTQSIKDIIKTHKPEIVILESVQSFSSIIEEIISTCPEYQTVEQLKIEGKADASYNLWLFRRQIVILKS
jgi:hypothetical protein